MSVSFPLDDVTLAAMKHALNGAYTVDDDGTHHLVGADYSFDQLLNFISGYDESKLIFSGYIGEIPCYEYPEVVFSWQDVMRDLIAEVERLRHAVELTDR